MLLDLRPGVVGVFIYLPNIPSFVEYNAADIDCNIVISCLTITSDIEFHNNYQDSECTDVRLDHVICLALKSQLFSHVI